MPVSSLPINMSEINAEFGAKSLATHFNDGDGGVGGLPGNMSEFAGLANGIQDVDVDPAASNTVISFNISENVEKTVYAIPDPIDVTGVTYVWTKVSGDTITNVQVGGDQKARKFSAVLSNQAVEAVYKCIATDAFGSVSHEFSVYLEHIQEGA